MYLIGKLQDISTLCYVRFLTISLSAHVRSHIVKVIASRNVPRFM